MMAMGKLELQCVQRHTSMGEGFICLMWWIYHSIIKRHGKTNVESFNKKRIYFNVSSGRGLNLHLAYKITQRVFMDPQITTFKPFNWFHR
jgi:hypothetical protein